MNLSEKETIAGLKVCLSLDGLATFEDFQRTILELSPVVGSFKIGSESYTRFGPRAVDAVHHAGANVFLDLKYHDIPTTVKSAARAAAEMGVYMFSVHASGGIEMMEAAVEGARSVSSSSFTPQVIGVTVLTSINQEMMTTDMRIPGIVEDQVFHLAERSYAAGLDGIVCAATDLSWCRSRFPSDFLYVTPGIYLSATSAGTDQKRRCTPGNAVKEGSSLLVIGRAITSYPTPEARLQAGYEILLDIAQNS